jgi:hypothetical protein
LIRGEGYESSPPLRDQEICETGEREGQGVVDGPIVRWLIGGLDGEVETGVKACGGLYVGPCGASFRKGLSVLERSAPY